MFAFRIVAIALLVFQSRAACPDNTWYNFNMICYKAFNDHQEWPGAVSKCSAYGAGAVLASIHDSSQNSFILMVMGFSGSSTAWIGLNDLAVEADYKWADQSKCKLRRQMKRLVPKQLRECSEIHRWWGGWAIYLFYAETFLTPPFTE